MNAFETETKESLKRIKTKYPRFYYKRIYDTQAFMKVSPIAIALKQPSDFMAVFKGRPWFIECKSSKNKTSYGFAYVKDHQVDELMEIANAGGNSFLLINNRSEKRNFKCYAIRVDKFKRLRDEHLFFGRKSVKWNELARLSINIPRLPAGLWKLESVFGIVYDYNED